MDIKINKNSISNGKREKNREAGEKIFKEQDE
jgi:hypothetical protein